MQVTGSAEGVYPGVHVERAGFLTDNDKDKINAGNALQLLGLKEEDYLPQDGSVPDAKRAK